MLPALEVSLDPHSASTALLLPARSASFQMVRSPPPPRGLRDAPLLRFLAPSAAFGLLRPQASCSLMSDVRFTSFPSVCSPTGVIQLKPNQTLAGTHRDFPAVRYTLRRLAPRRQQRRLTTLLALLPFTTSGAALIPSKRKQCFVQCAWFNPQRDRLRRECACPLLCHRHRRLDALSVAGCCTLTTRRNTHSLRPFRAFPPCRNLVISPMPQCLLPDRFGAQGFLRPSCVPAIGSLPHLEVLCDEPLPSLRSCLRVDTAKTRIGVIDSVQRAEAPSDA